MKWRAIDNLIASSCIQKLQQEINSGKRDAREFMVFIQDEEKAKEIFNAWRVYFIDRMSAEYDNHGWKNNGGIGSTQDMADIQHDIDYYNNLVIEYEQKQNKKGKSK